MIEENDKAKLVNTLSKMFNKYNLKEIECSVYTSHPMKDGKIIKKDLLYVKIMDNHGFKIEDAYFDVLEVNKCN